MTLKYHLPRVQSSVCGGGWVVIINCKANSVWLNLPTETELGKSKDKLKTRNICRAYDRFKFSVFLKMIVNLYDGSQLSSLLRYYQISGVGLLNTFTFLSILSTVLFNPRRYRVAEKISNYMFVNVPYSDILRGWTSPVGT